MDVTVDAMADVVDEIYEVNGEKKMNLQEQLSRLLAEGTEQIKAEDEKIHIKALGDALFRAVTEPECEVQLTYKTTAMATAAWRWMVWAAEKLGKRDKERSTAFDVELTNGSGIIFWTDEGCPEVPALEEINNESLGSQH